MKRSTLEKLKKIRESHHENSDFFTDIGFYNLGISEGISKAIMVLIENEEIEEDGIN